MISAGAGARPFSKQKIRDNHVFSAWLHEQAKQDDDGIVPAESALSEKVSDEAAAVSALTVTPREYQNELFERAKKKNTIVVLDTGSGKTLIAIMLLQHVLEQELEDRSQGCQRKTAFFVVDKVALCMQQYLVVRANLPFPVTKFYGELQPMEQDQSHWDAQFDDNMIVVCTAQILLDCLSHGFISMSQINLLIFDEVHHAKKEHPYAAIMKRYYPRSSSLRPRILGLTASPVDTQAIDMDYAVQRLESLMYSEIATVSDAVLEATWVKRERAEKVRRYSRLKSTEACYTDLMRRVEDYARQLPHLNAYVLCALKIARTLGPWCSDRFWKVILTDTAMKNMALQSGKENKVDFSYDKYEAASGALETLRPLISHHQFAAVSTEEGATSSKLAALREILSAAFEENSTTKCLVFVEEQSSAIILADYFQQPGIAPHCMTADFMVGLTRTSNISGLSQRDRMMKLNNFKYGQTNCLFATSVAEEGLDIPACDLVIRFDMCLSPIQYIQSRGRARKASSIYITMMEEDNLEHLRRLRYVTHGAQALRRFCQSLPENRKIELFERPTEKEFLVADTATLSHQNSMAVLARFVSTLAQGTDTSPVPEYVVSGAGSSFVCWVVLPDAAPFKSTTGSIERSKTGSRCAAAYDACVRLIEMGSINKNLQPTFKKQLPKMRNARLALCAKKQKQYSMRLKPKMWTQLPTDTPTRLFQTFIQFDPYSADKRPLVLLSRQELVEFEPIKLYVEADISISARLVKGDPVCVSEDQVQQLSTFTLHLFDQVFSKQFDVKPEQIPFYFAPYLSALYEYERQGGVDWQVLMDINSHRDVTTANHRGLGEFGGVPHQKFVIDPHDGSRKFIIDGIDPARRATDPTPVGVPAHKCRGYLASDKTIMQYSCSTRQNHREKIVFDTQQPVYKAELLSLRRNFLDDDDTDEAKKGQTCYITLQCLHVSSIPADIVRGALLLPSILYRLDTALIVAEACDHLGLVIPLSLALEAFTKDGCEPDEESEQEGQQGQQEQQEHAGNQCNYERLEFLGDTFLKMATTIALYTRNPTANEFEQHVERMLLVCNKNLFNTALNLDLQGYIRSGTFDRRTWYPNLPLLRGKTAKATVVQSLADKTIADVCEAVIGAAYVGGLASGSVDEAVRVVTKVVNHENHTMSAFSDYYAAFTVPGWHLAPGSAGVKATVDRIAEIVGYRFQSPLLLRSAFVHPSYKVEDIPNYQTLEFLGDALLDMAVVDYLFRKNPDAGPQWLTEHKMAVCGNQFLGCLCVELGLHREILSSDAQVPGQIKSFEEKLAYLQEQQQQQQQQAIKGYWALATRPPKLLADVVEALLGAMFVDSRYDYDVVRGFFQRFVQPHLDGAAGQQGFEAALGPGHVVTQAVHLLQRHHGCSRWRFCVSEVPCETRTGIRALTETDCICALLIHGQVRWHAKAGSGIEAKSKVAALVLADLRGADRELYRVKMKCDCDAPGGGD
ncbi:hypothetical protein PWT90_04002 [Aphanocladium album]|nr:hypothetical protein PWT90_04002 [Aphanocladium album]